MKSNAKQIYEHLSAITYICGYFIIAYSPLTSLHHVKRFKQNLETVRNCESKFTKVNANIGLRNISSKPK